MDEGKGISEQTLSRAVQIRPMPSMPVDMHRRIMQRVREQHEKRLRRERRLFCATMALCLLLTIGWGGWMLLRLHLFRIEFGEVEQMVFVALSVGFLLYRFHQRLFRHLDMQD